MPDITPRGYKKPLGTEGYAIDIVNFNTQLNEDEHNKIQTLTGNEAPSAATIGLVGQCYFDTTTKYTYICVAISGTTYTWELIDKYVREQMEQKADKATLLITNANLAIKNGKYAITAVGGLNIPIANNTFIIDTSQRSDGYLIQRAKCYSLAPYDTYERCCLNGIWTEWVKIATTDKIDILFESGTWTPTVRGNGTAGTVTYTTQSGKYTKVNNEVTLQFKVTGTISGATGAFIIGGSPYSCGTNLDTIGSLLFTGQSNASNARMHTNLLLPVVNGGATNSALESLNITTFNIIGTITFRIV